MALPVYEFKIDWQATDWMATPDYSQDIDDCSSYYKRYRTRRGKNSELGNAPAGICEVTLNNADLRFSPPYTSSPLYAYMRPMVPVRLRVTDNAVTTTLYTGFLDKIIVDSNAKEAYLYCTDGMDLLARNMVKLNNESLEEMTVGESYGKVLDAAGWDPDRRVIDTSGGDIIKYPRVTEF